MTTEYTVEVGHLAGVAGSGACTWVAQTYGPYDTMTKATFAAGMAVGYAAAHGVEPDDLVVRYYIDGKLVGDI